MKDKLQRFVRDNREAFDVHEPSDDLWNRLSEKLPKVGEIVGENTDSLSATTGASEDRSPAIVHEDYQNGGSYNPFFRKTWKNLDWRIAASIALIVGLGWVGYRINQNYGISETPEVALTDPNFARQVNQYTHLIDTKRTELRQMTESDPALYKEFAVELDQLERSYQNLKSDLPKNPNQEVVIQAMIQNLQWQIDLLNQQLDIIQRIKNKNNHANDKLS
ncbi:MAG: hypothetical protein U0X91_15450 [Spirosomataceae bacterium]